MTDNPQAEPVNPCTRGASFCGQHGYECPPSAPADRAAILRELADKADEWGGYITKQELRRMARKAEPADGPSRVADEAQQPETQAADRAAIIAEILPAWEAVYEPGTVSDYLIGYANSEAAAKGAAEAWMRSQAEVTGRLEWVPDEQLATGRYDQWFELIERHDDGIDTGPGLIVRRRVADEEQQQPTDEDVVEAHRLALSFAIGLGTGAPWDAIRDRAAELHDGDEAQQPGKEASASEVVAYRDPNSPKTLLCRDHGERWQGVVPVTAEELPDGGICTYGRLSSLECGRDVLTP